MTLAETSTLRRMCWVFPDRESTRSTAFWLPFFWDIYTDVAAEMGLEWSRVDPAQITVDASVHGKPRVFVDEEVVTPEDTLFITALYSLPYQAMAIFNQYTVFTVLEQAGFYLPVPPWLASIGNDKLSTLLFLQDSPIPTIPTIRIGIGPDVGKHLYEAGMGNLTYPAIVKPAGWCGGGGVNLANDSEEIRGLATLAAGGDTTLVAQPFLGDRTIDYRIYMIGGKAYPYCMRRTPLPGSPVSNASRGGLMDYPETPPELMAAVNDYFAKKLPVEFCCVDFLHDGERYWFSEIEPDGVICPDFADPERTLQRAMVKARWEAYRDGHATFLSTTGAR